MLRAHRSRRRSTPCRSDATSDPPMPGAGAAPHRPASRLPAQKLTCAPVDQPPKARVFFRSLGCPKNQVDSEVMLGGLALGGYAIAERLEDADVAVINTCSFIETARQESIEAILEVSELRERGRLRGLVVAG